MNRLDAGTDPGQALKTTNTGQALKTTDPGQMPKTTNTGQALKTTNTGQMSKTTNTGQAPKTTDPGQMSKTTPTQPKPKAEKEKRSMISAKHIKKQYGRQVVRVKQKIVNLWRRATVYHVCLDAEDRTRTRPKTRRHGQWNYVLLYLVVVCGAQVLCSEPVPGPDKSSYATGRNVVNGPVKPSYATGRNVVNGPDKPSYESGGKVEKPTILMDDASKDDAPKGDAPMDDAPKDDAPKDDAPMDDAPMGDAPMGDAPKDDAPMDDAPMGDAPKDDAPKDDAPMGDAPMGDAPKDDAPKDDAPKDDAPMGDAPGSRTLGDDETKDPHKESSELVQLVAEAMKGTEADSKPRNKRAEKVCTNGEMACDGKCIGYAKWCNGYVDCKDKKDEESCESYYCFGDDDPDGMTKCGGNSHLCVNRKYRCNGVKNDKLSYVTSTGAEAKACGGTDDDEADCSDYMCRGDMVACGGGTKLCVESKYRCDGTKNNELKPGEEVCGGNGADEEDCADYKCRGDMVACGGGKKDLCVKRYYRCDGEENNELGSGMKVCGGEGGADEKDCGGVDGEEPYECRGDEGMIDCPGKHMCMHHRDRCRSNPNVTHITGMPQPCGGDGSDTKHCNETATNSEDYKCEDPWKKCNDGKRCYLKDWECDGVNSCSDGTDEGNCTAVAGGVGEWSAWECGIKCGDDNEGNATRFRICDSPEPKFGGNCTEDLTETKPCKELNFTLKPCPGVGNWTHWAEWDWSGCGADKCINKEGHTKTRNRTRLCDNPTPVQGGLKCPAYMLIDIAKETCPRCKVDGGWSEWGLWSNCPITCGIQGTGGPIQIRRRSCNKPRMDGGKDCVGTTKEERPCPNLSACPGETTTKGIGFSKKCNGTEDEWECKDAKECIETSKKCDGNNDCADKSDESDCSAAPLLHGPGLLMTSLAVMTSLLM